MDPSLICRSNLQRVHVSPSAKKNVSIKCEQMLKAEVEGTKLPAFEDSPVGFPASLSRPQTVCGDYFPSRVTSCCFIHLLLAVHPSVSIQRGGGGS